eukprot:TRINITY_DN22603_c0_g1_i1.p1 TRINITY_DN22603_c0_g1~~TRINITY_DN22603_c0_g1_i1.p1  ORF type:complete len:490 (+),score=220.03 TRINITY_DN22603_c0_g1_i1:69-1538(+)
MSATPPEGSAPMADAGKVAGQKRPYAGREKYLAGWEKAEENKNKAKPEADAKEPKVKKRHYAVCFGYVGTGYQGLQYQEGFRTIEGELVEAFHQAGGVSAQNMEKGDSGLSALQKLGWQRSSRTDKGVHAVRNVVGLKLLEQGDHEAFVAKVNAALPEQIRCYEIQRTTSSFNAKNAVSGRHYHYVLPTFAFLDDYREYFSPDVAKVHLDAEDAAGAAAPDLDGCDDAEDEGKKNYKRRKTQHAPDAAAPTPADPAVPLQSAKELYTSVPEDIFAKLLTYRIGEATAAEVQRYLDAFIGTQWYHNYTREKPPGDPSSQRYITEFKIHSIEIVNGMEVMTLSVRGAAFLMHQIRRMVGMAIAAFNAKLGPATIKASLEQSSRHGIPTAPPTGLLLFDLFLDFYHKKLEMLQKNNERGSDLLAPLSTEKYQDGMKAMHRAIAVEIMRQEGEQRSMACWLRSLPHLTYKYVKQVNLYESIPEALAPKASALD